MLGLEEGAFPRRARPSPLLSDDLRRELGGRLERPDSVARDRYLFYTTCARAVARLFLVAKLRGRRRAARAEPVLGRRALAVRGGRRPARHAPPLALGADLAARVGAERARAAACARQARRREIATARLRSPPPTTGRAVSIRAQAAFDRSTELRGEVALGPLAPEVGVLGDRARAVLGLLLGVALRARHRSEADRRRAGPAPARPGSAHDTQSLLREPATRARLGAGHAGERRRGDRPRTPLSRRGARVRACASSSPSSRRRSSATRCGPSSRASSGTRRSRGSGSSRAGSRSRSAPTGRHPSSSADSRSTTGLALGEDRPHRRRSVQRARDRPGLQVGQGSALGARDRPRAAPADPAVRARAAGPRGRSSRSEACTAPSLGGG